MKFFLKRIFFSKENIHKGGRAYVLILFGMMLFAGFLSCDSKKNVGTGMEVMDERPNIVFIIADDLGFSDIGAYGGEIPTPNLDKLADSGTKYTQFYNNAVCVPTRASIYTGYYPAEGMKRIGSQDPNVHNVVTLGEGLKKAGYNTSLTGKWHIGHKKPNRPIDRGFDEFYGMLDGASNYFDPSMRDPEFYHDGRYRRFAHNDSMVTSFPEKYYTTDAFTEHAVGMIEKFSKSKAPFFINVAYNAPHFPMQAKEEDIERQVGKYDHLGNHKERYLQLRKERFQRQLEIGLIEPEWGLSEKPEGGGSWRYDYDIDKWIQGQDSIRELRRMEVYAAMVSSMDTGIGRILKALEDNNVADNTLVIFISDNGGCSTVPSPDFNSEKMTEMKKYNQSLPGGKDTYEFLGPAWGWAINTPFRRHKAWVYEGGIASPMIVKWPHKQKEGAINRDVIHVVDFAPTLMDITHGAIPKGWQGNIMTQTIKNEVVTNPERTYYWNINDNKAIRKGKWKLVMANGKDQWELYDMEVDRTETNDLATSYSEKVEELKGLWQEWDKNYKESVSAIESR
ncbi:sulfatase-like hydrolase/transferase [Flagellimonas olearia]|uniref:sulfatase-like hydrolase/transferase n=1 Tax=Flagellimonas olearia TaxID=552546 RepID=UPI0014795F32|nr:sulfatase-like hydrolase/transferase [Allomuricauda olearia]